MILSMSEQVLLFIYTVLAGFFLGFIYDVFRILRKTFRHSNLMTNIEDVCYWLIVSFSMFYFMLNKNYGEIRFFTIMGAFTGMVLYFATLSRLVMKVSMAVVAFLEKVLAAVIKIVLLPLRLILNILKIPVGFIIGLSKKALTPGKKVLKKSRSYAKIKSKKFKNDVRVILKKI